MVQRGKNVNMRLRNFKLYGGERWNLHIHTPGTKKNDNYTGTDDEKKWDNFYKKIETYVGDGTDPYKNIAVIGIIDYLSVENYFRVIREKD